MTRIPEHMLRGAGISHTRQRTAVLAALLSARRPLSAQEVHAIIAVQPGGRTGLATVYRIMRTLAAAGLIHEISLPTQRTYRACPPAPHHHLVCDQCGAVTEYPAGLAEGLLERISGATGFTPGPAAADIHGTCPACPAGEA